MNVETSPHPPILTIAWTRFAQLDAFAVRRSKPHLRLRWWIAALGVLATLFAVLTEIYPPDFPAAGGTGLKVLLILTPILGSLLASYVNRFYAGGDWLVARAGAEEIKKEIYFYRTILRNVPNRREYLEKRLAEIQRSVFRDLKGELLLGEYRGPLPPVIDEQAGDTGFHDLSGDEYYRVRLQSQLRWHADRLRRVHRERMRLQVYILLAGAAGAFLAALGGPFSLWVALTSSLAAALIGWQELRNLDMTVRNYSKVISELTIIANHWEALEPEERGEAEFFGMVNATEEVLWSQHVEYVRSMQEALAQARLEQAGLIENVLRQARESDARLRQAQGVAIGDQFAAQTSEAQAAALTDYREVLGQLADVLRSDVVRQELAAMRAAGGAPARLSERLEAIAARYAGKEFGPETPKEELNSVLASFPPTGEVKG